MLRYDEPVNQPVLVYYATAESLYRPLDPSSGGSRFWSNRGCVLCGLVLGRWVEWCVVFGCDGVVL